MTQHNFDWTQINAYVDGELPASQAAVIADAASEDPELAQQIAALTHMKYAVTAEFRGQKRSASAVPVNRRRKHLWTGLAATFLAAVFMAAIGFAFTMQEHATSESWFAAASRTHAALSDGQPAKSVDSDILLAALPRLGSAAFVPDLSAARLRAGGVAELDHFAGGRAVAIGYYGTRGCRLTVLMTDADLGLDDKMRKLDRSAPEAYGWRIGELSYLVMATRMAPKRFATIAGSVHWSSVRAARPDDEIRTALRLSRRNSPPCAQA